VATDYTRHRQILLPVGEINLKACALEIFTLIRHHIQGDELKPCRQLVQIECMPHYANETRYRKSTNFELLELDLYRSDALPKTEYCFLKSLTQLHSNPFDVILHQKKH